MRSPSETHGPHGPRTRDRDIPPSQHPLPPSRLPAGDAGPALSQPVPTALGSTSFLLDEDEQAEEPARNRFGATSTSLDHRRPSGVPIIPATAAADVAAENSALGAAAAGPVLLPLRTQRSAELEETEIVADRDPFEYSQPSPTQFPSAYPPEPQALTVANNIGLHGINAPDRTHPSAGQTSTGADNLPSLSPHLYHHPQRRNQFQPRPPHPTGGAFTNPVNSCRSRVDQRKGTFDSSRAGYHSKTGSNCSAGVSSSIGSAALPIVPLGRPSDSSVRDFPHEASSSILHAPISPGTSRPRLNPFGQAKEKDKTPLLTPTEQRNSFRFSNPVEQQYLVNPDTGRTGPKLNAMPPVAGQLNPSGDPILYMDSSRRTSVDEDGDSAGSYDDVLGNYHVSIPKTQPTQSDRSGSAHEHKIAPHPPDSERAARGQEPSGSFLSKLSRPFTKKAGPATTTAATTTNTDHLDPQIHGEYMDNNDDGQPRREEEEPWNAFHPCYPLLNPYVSPNDPAFFKSRIVRVRREWEVGGDIAPQFPRIFPQILEPYVLRDEFLTLIDKLNDGLAAAFDPFTAEAWLDGLMGFLTFWLWEDLGLTAVKRRLRVIEQSIDDWNKKKARKKVPISIISLRRTGYMSIDFQIPDPQLPTVADIAQPYPHPHPNAMDGHHPGELSNFPELPLNDPSKLPEIAPPQRIPRPPPAHYPNGPYPNI